MDRLRQVPIGCRASEVRKVHGAYITAMAIGLMTATASAQPAQDALTVPRVTPADEIKAEGDCEMAGTWRGAMCWDGQVKWFDATLNASYQRALAVQKSREQAVELRKSQRAWLQYVDANCTLIGRLDGGEGGSAAFYSLFCRANEYSARIKFLNQVVTGP